MGVYGVSGLDQLNAIEILAFATKISKPLVTFMTCPFFLSWQAQEAVLPGEAVLYQGKYLTTDDLFGLEAVSFRIASKA